MVSALSSSPDREVSVRVLSKDIECVVFLGKTL